MVEVRVHEAALNVLPMNTRFPFHYGIAAMTWVPHVFLRVVMTVDGARCHGVAAEGLPPKWFTKDPDTTFEEDLPAMIGSIRGASRAAVGHGAGTFFELSVGVAAERRQHGAPALLDQLGVALLERAVLDGICRKLDTDIGTLVRSDVLGIALETVHPELSGAKVRELLPERPATSLTVRHTVGLTDPLDDADVMDPIDDGLPHTLREAIDAYALTHFKVKVSGDLEADTARLARIARLLPAGAVVTIDGNEQFTAVEQFLDHHAAWSRESAVRSLLDRTSFIEQPLHRARALDPRARITACPHPVIIDESDASPEDLRDALRLGYAGTSHKNCKGIVKGIANACLLARRRQHDPRTMLSGEDLANVGPVALLQDLAILATLGVPHAERNGHHYFRGLSAFPGDVQDAVLDAHGDLYRRHPDGFATLRIERGRLDLRSVVAAPFGLRPELDPLRFQQIDDWLRS